MKLKSNIKIRLVQLDIKQQNQVAKSLNVSNQTFSGWATGKNNPTLLKAFELAKFLGCKVDDLWELKEDNKLI